MSANKKLLVASRYERARLRTMAQLVTGSRVLDIGYADMPNVDLVRPGRHITGIDLSAAPLGCPYDVCLQDDIFRLHELIGGQLFDSVVAGEFIEHIEEPYALLRQLRRVIAPSGQLILSTPNPVSFPVIFWEWLRSPARFFAEDHVYYFPPRWMVRLIERSGFRVERVKGVGLWPTLLPCPIGLSYQVVYAARPV